MGSNGYGDQSGSCNEGINFHLHDLLWVQSGVAMDHCLTISPSLMLQVVAMSSNRDRDDNKYHARGLISIFISNTWVHLVVLQWTNVQSPSSLSSKWLQWVQMEMEINLVDHAMGA
jgi:hypothetical protein